MITDYGLYYDIKVNFTVSDHNAERVTVKAFSVLGLSR